MGFGIIFEKLVVWRVNRFLFNKFLKAWIFFSYAFIIYCPSDFTQIALQSQLRVSIYNFRQRISHLFFHAYFWSHSSLFCIEDCTINLANFAILFLPYLQLLIEPLLPWFNIVWVYRRGIDECGTCYEPTEQTFLAFQFELLLFRRGWWRRLYPDLSGHLSRVGINFFGFFLLVQTGTLNPVPGFHYLSNKNYLLMI